ncbi:MAG: HD domain-containing protein [Clostridia bacterium]|nr:HD domain-containing protein [Clostridia bacterium]
MNKILKKYIDNNIKIKYKNFDKAHNISHYNFVTRNCISYSKQLINKGEKIDLDIAFIVGAYHDIGILNGRENHAISSGKFVRNDEMLNTFYDKETIEIIAQAVEDHSSHLTYTPRNIYGKIVADADRNNTKYLVFSRPIKYGLKHENHLSKQEQIERVYNFVQNKFGRNGYVKYYLDIDETKKEQQEIWALLDNEILCKNYIEGLFDEITKGKYKQKNK